MHTKGSGYAPASGPTHAPIAIILEALGGEEVYAGIPAVGPAGQYLDNLLRSVGIDRSGVRVDNTIRCRPPNNWLVKAPWEHTALAHCSPYHEETLREPHKVIITMGATSTKKILGLPSKGHKQDNWHGCPTEIPGPDGRPIIVVPTYHPSHLLQGNHKLKGTVRYDLLRAKQVAQGTWQWDDPELVVDPPVEWFQAWAENFWAQARNSPSTSWLPVDIETQQKLAGTAEDELDDDDVPEIVRVNFSCHQDEGISVPFIGAYIPIIKSLCEGIGVKIFWNERYDIPILRYHGIFVSDPHLDFMWGWHVLQSDLPRGLGFVSPFYSRGRAWKHLASTTPGPYAAMDGAQTMRCALGITRDLQAAGLWEAFHRHVYLMDTLVLYPAEAEGLLIDRTALLGDPNAPEGSDDRLGLQGRLAREQKRIRKELQAIVPDELKPQKVWKRDPGKREANQLEEAPQITGADDLLATVSEEAEEEAGPIISITRSELVQCCAACGAIEIAKSHRCADRSLTPSIHHREADVTRWVRQLNFNPASTDQIIAYFNYKGYPLQKSKGSKTGDPSADKKILESLYKKTGDPFFRLVLDDRKVGKVKGTYVDGAEARMDANDRLHAEFLHVPSTLRLSCVRPNLQNVVADRAGGASLEAGFRLCVVSLPGHSLVEVDFSGGEAVQTGWFAGDGNYIRLAWLGVHAYLASHIVGEPIDFSWPDERIIAAVEYIKGKYPKQYEMAKRCIHGTSYGMSPIGMANNYPEVFNRNSAAKTQELLFAICPKLKAYHNAVRMFASKNTYAGGGGWGGASFGSCGAGHPYGYRHWFFNIFNYTKASGNFVLGEDAKRVIAFPPQSTLMGVLAEAMIDCHTPDSQYYIGDCGPMGRTPTRALIHDSWLGEVPNEKLDRVLSRVVGRMELPILQQPNPPEWHEKLGTHLRIGVEVKVGKNWAAYNDNPEKGPLNLVGMKKVKMLKGVVGDTAVRDEEQEGADVS